MTEWYWSTLSSHNGVFSPGGFLIMSLRQVGDPDCLLSNDERMQAYDRLLTFAGECIGAGC